MDPKGGNPFLMDDYAAETAGGLPAQGNSNPFLQDFTDTASSGAGENPFLNFSSNEQTYEPPVDSTNPFASFGIESITPDVGFGATTTNTPATNVFTSQSSNIFVTSDTASVDLFGVTTEKQATMTTTTPVTSPPQPQAATPPSKNGKLPPSRPPPPRPQPPAPPAPPVKNTKDLILSVTGAMDATSNHLLDRLQMTRTPSPTLMHSPSPTPEHSFADLLDVDSNVPDLIPDDSKTVEPSKNQDIMDLFDTPNTDVTATAIFSTSMTTTGTTSLVSQVPLSTTTITATKQDNPFDSMSEEPIPVVSQAQPAFPMDYPGSDIIGEKRPSVSSVTPFTNVDAEISDSSSVVDLTEPAPPSAAELFQGRSFLSK